MHMTKISPRIRRAKTKQPLAKPTTTSFIQIKVIVRHIINTVTKISEVDMIHCTILSLPDNDT